MVKRIAFLLSVIAASSASPLPPSCVNRHTVAAGDICFDIAGRYGLTVDQLMASNPQINCKNLQIGESLCVAGGRVPSPKCSRVYNVVAGDTCHSIATKNGLTLNVFLSYNPEISCERLSSGQPICLSLFDDANQVMKIQLGPLSATLPIALPDVQIKIAAPSPCDVTVAPLATAAAQIKPIVPIPIQSTIVVLPPVQSPVSAPKPPVVIPPVAPAPQPTIQKAPAPQTTTIKVAAPQPTTVKPSVASDNNSNGDNGLAAHNSARAAYGSKPLSWSDSLASSAQTVARGLASRNCQLDHSGLPNVGENLYGIYGTTQTTVTDAVNRWVNEDKSGNVYNHWTQVVWGSTTQVGCSVVPGNACAVVVCHYSPAGNMIGQLPNGRSK